MWAVRSTGLKPNKKPTKQWSMAVNYAVTRKESSPPHQQLQRPRLFWLLLCARSNHLPVLCFLLGLEGPWVSEWGRKWGSTWGSWYRHKSLPAIDLKNCYGLDQWAFVSVTLVQVVAHLSTLLQSSGNSCQGRCAEHSSQRSHGELDAWHGFLLHQN